MADDPDTKQPLSPSKFVQSWGLGPKYLEVPPDEERISQRKHWSGQYLKYGLILICVALLGSWLTWLNFRTGHSQEGSPSYVLSAEAIQDLRQAINSTERDRRYQRGSWNVAGGTTPTPDYGTAPIANMGKCNGGGEAEDRGKVLLEIAEKSAKVIGVLAKVDKRLAGPSAMLDFIVKQAKGEVDWEKCIMKQVEGMNKENEKHKMKQLLRAHSGMFGQLQNKIRDYEESKTSMPEAHKKAKEKEIWDFLRTQEQMIAKEGRQHFETNFAAVYESGPYYVMPYFASVHFEYLTLKIRLAQSLNLVEPSLHWQVPVLKSNLGKWIQFYSEVGLRFWRKARDNWCKGADEGRASRKCGCKCVSPPYKKYLPVWAKLARTYEQTSVQRKITQWLESNKIKSGDEVAFKYSRPMAQLSWPNDLRAYNDADGDESGWLSCTGGRAYCYLRDCPGNYITGKTGCSGERFTIQDQQGVDLGRRGADIVSGGYPNRIFLQNSHDEEYLNLYTCGDLDKMEINRNTLPKWNLPGSTWWNSEEFGSRRERNNLNNRRAVQIHLAPEPGAKIPPAWTPPGYPPVVSPKRVLENGDFVRIESEHRCGSVKSVVMDGWFEIIKTTDGPITNKWQNRPVSLSALSK